MGRIKSRFVKSSAQKIYEKGQEEFTENFDTNKSLISKFAVVPSKKLKNTIAGYITRLKKTEEE